jgi:hypothetical protein
VWQRLGELLQAQIAEAIGTQAATGQPREQRLHRLHQSQGLLHQTQALAQQVAQASLLVEIDIPFRQDLQV